MLAAVCCFLEKWQKNGSVEKSWGRFLNEAYLRRTYLRGGLQCTASEMGKRGTEITSPILDKRKGR